MRRGFIDGFQLKAGMAVLMLLDHIHYYFPASPDWFHYLGRLVAPVFTFLIAEGLIHTRSRPRYILRLALFGAVMLAGNRLLGLATGFTPQNSILLSFAVGAALVDQLEKVRAGNAGRGNRAAVVLLALLSAVFEGSVLIPMMLLIFYYLRGNRLLMCAAFASLSLLLVYLLMGKSPQMLMVFAVLPILAYNGGRGISNAFSKYFFYLFYPLHIWMLQAIWFLNG